ncbi:MAG: biotin transporter BioY [Clostridiales bacterium]|jgi:biotin transport system substrate-specific component|nr:biotin transporter BioY [Clostridiales bacterium]
MKSKKLQRLAATGIFAAASAVLSQISFTIPMTSVPFSLGIMAAFLSGALLPEYYALLSQLIFISLGAAGIPVFSQFRGGLSVIVGPTGGYILGYLLIAFFVSLTARHFKKRLWLSLSVSMVATLFADYALGTVWFVIQTNTSPAAALLTCVVPFIIPDMIKIFVCINFSLALKKALEKSGLSVLN